MKKKLLILNLFIPIFLLTFFACSKTEDNSTEVDKVVEKSTNSVIEIGSVLPLTGEAAQWGIPPKQGAELAVEEINAAGGINGRKLKLYTQDSSCNPATSVSAFQNLLVMHPEIKAIVGAVCSSSTLAIAPIAERREILLISPASTSPKISEAGYYIFRNIPTDTLRGRVFAEYVFMKANIRKICLLYINNDAGVGNKDAFANRFKELGGTISCEEAYPQGAHDVRSQLTKIKAQYPEALMVVSYPEDTIVVVKQARELIPKMLLFFQAEAVEDPSVIKALGPSLNGVTYILPAKAEGEVPDRFQKAYKNRFGSAPELFAAEGYDCVYLLADAIKQNNGIVNSNAIKSYLYSVKNFAGASGVTTFDKNGDVIKPMAVKQIENGTSKILSVSE